MGRRKHREKQEDIWVPYVEIASAPGLVTDKGYHSAAVVQRVKAYLVRSYIPEKQQKGRRNWKGKAEEQQAVCRNWKRVRSNYGKSLLRWRGELMGTQLRPLLRDGQYAAHPPAKTREHSQAATDPCGSFQSEPDSPQDSAGTPRELANRLAEPLIRFFSQIWSRIEQRRAPSSSILRQPQVFTPTLQHSNHHLRCRNYLASTTGC